MFILKVLILKSWNQPVLFRNSLYNYIFSPCKATSLTYIYVKLMT